MRRNQCLDGRVGLAVHVPKEVKTNHLEHGVTYVITEIEWFAGTVVVRVGRVDGKYMPGEWFEVRRFDNGPSPYMPGQIQNRCRDTYDPLTPYAEWNRQAYRELPRDQDEGGIV